MPVPSFLNGPPETTLFHALRRELDIAAVQLRPVSLAFVDVDDLTGFNERHGWDIGTVLLNRVGEALTAIGPDVSVGSFGGDEFAVVFPGTRQHKARFKMHQTLVRIASIEVVSGTKRERPYASVGGSTSSTGSTPAELIRAAHDALVTSKRTGGRCVTWVRTVR